MTSIPGTGYQPAVAYQGGQVNTPQQEPVSGRTQPQRPAPAADTQRGDRRTQPEPEVAERGGKVDVRA